MMWAVSAIDYHALLHRVFYLYGAALALLIVTALVGGTGFLGPRVGSRLARFTFQTSEFVKIVLILLVAKDAGGHSGADKLTWQERCRRGF